MRNDLLLDLTTIGYEISLEGDHVKLRYRKSGSPPDTVKPLIDELRKCKAEVVNVLKMGCFIAPSEESQPPVQVKAAWPPEIQSLVDWFLTMDPPPPFYLESHLHVKDPEKFFQLLRRESETGPRGPRARLGALQSDLRKLKVYFSDERRPGARKRVECPVPRIGGVSDT
jgi:hypothetical protein